MQLPQGDEYQTAVQNPRIAFADPELKQGKIELTRWGLPKPYSGGFTITYHLVSGTRQWAIRCFRKAVPDLRRRYQAIEHFVERNADGTFVETSCQQQGIFVLGQWSPIIKMRWVEGTALNVYAKDMLSRPAALTDLAQRFRGLAARLEQLGVAHGDLQHGNVIVKGGQLHLIDYDDMFLPELAGLKPNGIGHINYQHPLRSADHYGPSIDRFSAIVIHTGLLALSVAPQLWARYDTGENLLFSQADFADADRSPLLAELAGIANMGPIVDRFRGICRQEPDALPTLSQFISGGFLYPKAPAAVSPGFIPRTQYFIIPATERGLLSSHIGERVEVIGQITDHRNRLTRYGQPYLFLNFGRFPDQTCTLVLWAPGLAAFRQAQIDPVQLAGRWVSATGVITSYQGRPQIEIEIASQVKTLRGEEEAKRRLGIGDSHGQAAAPTATSGPPVVTTPSAAPGRTPSTLPAGRAASAAGSRTASSTPTMHDDDTPISREEADALNELYGDHTVTPAPTVSQVQRPAAPAPPQALKRVPSVSKATHVVSGILVAAIAGSLAAVIVAGMGGKPPIILLCFAVAAYFGARFGALR